MSHLDLVINELKQVRGVDFSGYRRAMLLRRLAARMAKLHLTSQAAYLARLKSVPAECDRLLETIAINVSSFFRNALVFELMRETILPEIIERKRRGSPGDIRVWSAGCGNGEEAYSIAILVHDLLKGEQSNGCPYIFATDIDAAALATARVGAYERESFATTKLGVIDRYFKPTKTGFQVRPFLRKMVRFSWHDLASDGIVAPPESIFGAFDLVLCRNVLIYFQREHQVRILARLHKAIAGNGYLVLGEAESLDEQVQHQFVTVDRKNRIFQRQRAAQARQAPNRQGETVCQA